MDHAVHESHSGLDKSQATGMSVDIRQGINRVQEGLFPGRAPYGYRNVRIAGRLKEW